MKKVFSIAAAVFAFCILYACIPSNAKDPVAGKAQASAEVKEGQIKWLTWDEAVKANEKQPKKIFIDFYTDWCGWCKRMDATTFVDPAVVEYINKNFHAVKFNAEQKEDIVFQGTTFQWQAGGRNGYHKLAFELLNGRLGYPSFVYLTPTFERILISPGYKQPEDLQKELKFVFENHYASTSWEQYRNSN